MLSPSLLDAIDNADLSRLRKTLKRVCDVSNDARTLTEKQLLRPTKKRASGSSRSAPEVLDLCSDDGPTASTFHMPPSQLHATSARLDSAQWTRFAVCANCKSDFNVVDNAHGNCRYHTGESIICLILCYNTFQASALDICRS